MEDGSRAKPEAMGLKSSLTELYLKESGKNQSSSRASASSLMAKYTMESGLTVSLRVTGSKLGQTVGDTKVNGSKESLSVKVLKLIRMARPREVSGKAASSLSLARSLKEKMLTF